MALSDMANASNEKREQRIMMLRQAFNQQKCITVASGAKYLGGYAYSTVLKYAKDGNIPLMDKDGKPVVPITEENSPEWLKDFLNAKSTDSLLK